MPTISKPSIRSLSTLAFTLALALLPSEGDARNSKPATGTIELELRTLTGKKTTATHEFVLPIAGELAGTVELFEQTHWCRFNSRERKDEVVSIDLTCYQGGRSREHVSFEFGVERSFELDSELVLGELAVRADERIQVVATRH